MKCSQCNNDLPADARFCPTCGAAQAPAATGATQRLGTASASPRSIRDGTCPQCGADAIYVDGEGLIADRSPVGANLHTFLFGRAALHTYVCASCGYVELYIAHKEELAAIAQKWQRVPRRKK